MLHRTLIRLWAVLMLGVLAACGSQPVPASPAATAAPPTSAPVAPSAASALAPTAAGSSAATAAPTAAGSSAATAAPTAQLESSEAAAIPEGLTPEGYHMLGRPDAPITLVMYSDFL